MQHRDDSRQMRVGELASLDLEPVVPVAVAQTFREVTQYGQLARLPLFENVAILVQHQPGIGEEIGPASAQVDAARTGRRNGADVQARIQGMLEDLHVIDGLTEGLHETIGDARG